MKYYTIDKGLADREGRPLSPYVAMCHLLCDSVEEYQSSFGPYAPEIREDIPNFTDGTSIHQISEVVVENSAKIETAALQRSPIDRGTSPRRSDQVIR